MHQATEPVPQPNTHTLTHTHTHTEALCVTRILRSQLWAISGLTRACSHFALAELSKPFPSVLRHPLWAPSWTLQAELIPASTLFSFHFAFSYGALYSLAFTCDCSSTRRVIFSPCCALESTEAFGTAPMPRVQFRLIWGRPQQRLVRTMERERQLFKAGWEYYLPFYY